MGNLIQHLDSKFQIFTIDDAFSQEDMSKFHRVIDGWKYDTHTFTSSPFKNGKIVLPEVSNLIWNRLQTAIPSVYHDHGGIPWEIIGVPNTVMYAEVKPGQRFGLHSDTGCVFDDGGRIKSSHTVLIYLNDNFSGGTTQFVDDNFKDTVTISPRINRTLCFDIEMFHRGDPVVSGIKRWIGTELISKRIFL